jgi:hypothetical protein
MSKPKNMTPEQEAAWKANRRAYKNDWAKRKFRESAEFREKERAKKRKWQNNWRSDHPVEARNRVSKTDRKRRDDIADCYVRKVLCAKSKLKAKDIPQNLVSLKREHLKMKRKLKTIETNDP